MFHLGQNDVILGRGANETNFPAKIWPTSLDCTFIAKPELLDFFPQNPRVRDHLRRRVVTLQMQTETLLKRFCFFSQYH